MTPVPDARTLPHDAPDDRPGPDGRAGRAPRRAARPLATAALAVAALVAPAAAASAAEPIDLGEQVVDEAGVLGSQEAEVRAAVEQLATDAGIDLYVVFVDDFSGRTYAEWGTETATLSGLGGSDALLAVAVEQRDYYFDATQGSEVQAAVEQARDGVRAQLSSDDWAGAALAATEGLSSATTTGTGADPAPGGSGAADTGGGGFLTLLLVGAVVVVGFLLIRSRRRKPAGGPGQPPAAPGAPRPQGLEALPTAELDRRAAAALVRIDDAIRTSEQELGFAQAQFGVEATREFEQVLTTARARVLEAFHLRQVLDDSTPDTEDVVRDHSLRILRLCQGVAEDLDAQTDRFDELRDLQQRAPELLATDEARAREVRTRIEPARRTLERLRTTYPAEALASVAANPDQAEALLTQVDEAVARGRAALEAGDRAEAVDLARASENAVGQAVTLLDAVDRAGDDLASAGRRLEQAIASISADVEDARRL
ncbi:TPM domain-containing protein, partial [Cellulomonas carbonis]